MYELSNEELAALILPWAKEHKPEPYAKTLAVAGKPDTFRAYLARLIELRWNEEKEWRTSAPLRALEETALVVRMRHPGIGVEIEVKGRRAPGGRQWGFCSMADMLERGVDFETAHRIITGFDLEVVD